MNPRIYSAIDLWNNPMLELDSASLVSICKKTRMNLKEIDWMDLELNWD